MSDALFIHFGDTARFVVWPSLHTPFLNLHKDNRQGFMDKGSEYRENSTIAKHRTEFRGEGILHIGVLSFSKRVLSHFM